MELLLIVLSVVLPAYVLWGKTMMVFRVDTPPSILSAFLVLWALFINTAIEPYFLWTTGNIVRTPMAALIILILTAAYYLYLTTVAFEAEVE